MEMLDYNNNRLKDRTSDPTVGCYRQYKYQYHRPEDENIPNQVGTVTLATTGILCYRASRECTKENLWAMPYPPSELSLDPNLKLDPVPYDFGNDK